MLSIINSAVSLLGRESRGRWLLLVVVAIVASGFELIGALLVFVLLGVVAEPDVDLELPLIGDFRDFLPGLDDQTLLLTLIAAMALFFFLRATVHVSKVYIENRVAENFGARLSTRLAHSYLKMPYAFHLQRSSSQLIRNSYQAVGELIKQIYIPMIKILAESTMVIAMLVLLFVIAPLATLLAIGVLGSTSLIMAWVIQPKLKRLGRASHRLQKETLGVLQQSLHGIRDIKILGRESAFADQFGRGRMKLARAKYLRSMAAAVPRDVLELALLGFILSFFAIAVASDQGAEGMLSVLGLFAYAGVRIQPAMQAIVSGINNLKFASAPLQDIYDDLELFDTLPTYREDGKALPLREAWTATAVSFQYDATDRPALRDINLTISPGETVGVCGPTGGGKTTLIDVLTGLLAPTEGRVTVDGIDLVERARSWHRSLGMVPQMIFLTDDTLRRNIALGVPSGEIDDDAVYEAVHLAQLDDFIQELPHGLDTVVGERGVRVSGGQRQRVAIARALYQRPEVLIFDEGTSALDNRTEAELMSALERLRGDHTILLIAHRLSTVQDCDRIIYLEGGRISGLGTYEELLESNEGFRRLARMT